MKLFNPSHLYTSVLRKNYGIHLTSKNSFWFGPWITLKWMGTDSPWWSSLDQAKYNYLIENGEGGPIFRPRSALNLAHSRQRRHMELATFQVLKVQDFLQKRNTSKSTPLTQALTTLGRGQGRVQSHSFVPVLSMQMTHHLDWWGYAFPLFLGSCKPKDGINNTTQAG